MGSRVAIIGLGFTPARPTSSHQSYKEMMFEAAQRAYADAAIEAADVQSFVTCAEDLNEGLSIFDEYTPDQLGAMLKPMHTLTQDGLHGLADAALQILSGLFELVVVEAHSKASNIVAPDWVADYATDPVLNRPLGLNPHYIAGLEMQRFLHEAGVTHEQCTHVAAKNYRHALRNPVAAYPAHLEAKDVLASPPAFEPLHEREIARTADGCIVLVVAGEDRARRSAPKPVWVRGVGWANGSFALETRNWARPDYVRRAAEIAYRQAGINDPAREIQLCEVDDTYSYKELQHLAELGIFANAADAARATEQGQTQLGARLPVNVSGGVLGMGNLLEANGLARAAELVLQLRGQAGARQVEGVRVGLAQSWRGVPTTSAAVAVLSVE
jgi:acetyl-CoA C-acetyltransferase